MTPTDGDTGNGMPRRENRLAPGARVLVTGCAGFLGSHLSERLLAVGHDVVGVDCFTDFYERNIKAGNLECVRGAAGFELHELDLGEDDLSGLLEGIDAVVHLAAQAGVRGSFGTGFGAYLHHNVRATQRLLEEAVDTSLMSFTYASSSSVYGNAAAYPTTEDSARRPVSPYGMTKGATEDLAGVYHRSFGIPTVGLRYFTAYGPRQRPDMAFSRFLTRALRGDPLPLIGDGRQVRDFTYVDDIIDGTLAAVRHGVPGRVYNIGGGRPVELRGAIALIEELVGRPISVEPRPAQVGEARATGCDGSLALADLGYAPTTDLATGLAAQLEWLAGEGQSTALSAIAA